MRRQPSGREGRGGEGELHRHPHAGRSLQEEEDDGTTSTADFEAVFLNDPGETVAAGRGSGACGKLLDGREVRVCLRLVLRRTGFTIGRR